MRVAILYNQPMLPDDDPEAESEKWVATAVANVSEALAASGHEALKLGVGRSLSSLGNHLALMAPDVVFNLFEGFADQPASEARVVAGLERLNIPFTGSSSRTLSKCLSKHRTKQRLVAAGLPTPQWMTVERPGMPALNLSWPVIIKPAARDASEGIDQASIVTNCTAATDRVSRLLSRYGPPVMLEEFLSGREFTVSLIEVPELRALPIAEVIFRDVPGAPWPLLTYAAKWMPESADYEATDMRHAAPLAPELAQTVEEHAKRDYRAFGCRDYARVDIRLNAEGAPMILDVNPNPDMSPTACFAYALKAAQIERTEFIAALTEQAKARARQTTITAG